MMKKLYIIFIVIGIITEIALFIFFEKHIVAYGPIIFWAIGGISILHYGVNTFKISNSVKKTKPELYKKHSFGIMITRSALSNHEFLSALNEDEQKLLELNKTLFKYFFLCAVLFAISAILIVLI